MAETFFVDKIQMRLNLRSQAQFHSAEELSSLIITTATDVPSQPPSAGDGTADSSVLASLRVPAQSEADVAQIQKIQNSRFSFVTEEDLMDYSKGIKVANTVTATSWAIKKFEEWKSATRI